VGSEQRQAEEAATVIGRAAAVLCQPHAFISSRREKRNENTPP